MNITIRPTEISDAKEISAIRIMEGVIDNILAMPNETEQSTAQFIQNLDNNTYHFVAVDDDTKHVVGVVGMSVFSNPRTRHSAAIGIMVAEHYQSKGIGKKLMTKILDIADNYLKLVRVELGVYTDNSRAISLYEHFGFKIEGTKLKSAIRLGEYADEYIMARIKD